MESVSLLSIFLISFSTSLVSFGGGYLIIPILKKEYVVKRKALTQEQLNQISNISQSSPGAIAINFTGGIGYKLKGGVGALVAVIGSVIPPFIIIVFVTQLYSVFIDNTIVQAIIKGLDLSVIAIMVGLNLSMFYNLKNRLGYQAILLAVVFFLLTYFSIFPIPVLLVLNYVALMIVDLKELNNGNI